MEIIYMAVRSSPEKEEWVDLSTHSFTTTQVEEKIRDDADKIPFWNKRNPVIRIGTFKVEEIKHIPNNG